jgi:hypothetical protein
MGVLRRAGGVGGQECAWQLHSGVIEGVSGCRTTDTHTHTCVQHLLLSASVHRMLTQHVIEKGGASHTATKAVCAQSTQQGGVMGMVYGFGW